MRPTIHMTAPSNWINDPNGPIHWDGRYHVFFQHHPEAPKWGRIQWGHASSADLVSWTRHEPALVPSDAMDAPDRDGCWSGSVAIVDGVPTAFYTGAAGDGAAHLESVCRASSEGPLTTWRKDADNPVIDGRRRPGRMFQRDPFLLRLGGRWLMLLGTGLVGSDGATLGGAVVVLESSDARDWQDRGVLFHLPIGTSEIETGPMWECPQLFEAGGRWILLVSVQARGGPDPVTLGVIWFAGDLVDAGPGLGIRFEPAATGAMDAGDVFYAPAVFDAPDGRTLAWGWIRDPDPDLSGDPGGVVVGALSLPRVLGLDGQRLVSRPVPELNRLATGIPRRIDELRLKANERHTLEIPAGDDARARRVTVDIDALASLDTTSLAGIIVAAAVDDAAALGIGIQRTVGGAIALVAVDIAGSAITIRHEAAVPTTDLPVRLDVFVDGPIVEAFAVGVALAIRVDRRILPADRIDLAAWSGSVRFLDIVATALGPAGTIGDG
jgi:beta-fructofuranosidase